MKTSNGDKPNSTDPFSVQWSLKGAPSSVGTAHEFAAWMASEAERFKDNLDRARTLFAEEYPIVTEAAADRIIRKVDCSATEVLAALRVFKERDARDARWRELLVQGDVNDELTLHGPLVMLGSGTHSLEALASAFASYGGVVFESMSHGEAVFEVTLVLRCSSAGEVAHGDREVLNGFLRDTGLYFQPGPRLRLPQGRAIALPGTKAFDLADAVHRAHREGTRRVARACLEEDFGCTFHGDTFTLPPDFAAVWVDAPCVPRTLLTVWDFEGEWRPMRREGKEVVGGVEYHAMTVLALEYAERCLLVVGFDSPPTRETRENMADDINEAARHVNEHAEEHEAEMIALNEIEIAFNHPITTWTSRDRVGDVVLAEPGEKFTLAGLQNFPLTSAVRGDTVRLRGAA